MQETLKSMFDVLEQEKVVTPKDILQDLEVPIENGPIYFSYTPIQKTQKVRFNSLETRINYALRELEDVSLYPDGFKLVIEEYPIGKEKDPNEAYLLLQKDSCDRTDKIICVPVKKGNFSAGFRRVHIKYDKNKSSLSETSNIEFFARLPLYFQEHDLSDSLEHDVDNGFGTLYVAQDIATIHPELIDIGKKRKLEEYFEQALWGAMLHDIGKIMIPYEILNKPGKLTPEEWEIMKKHSIYGYRILEGIPGLELGMHISLNHHEAYDGGGYPSKCLGAFDPVENKNGIFMMPRITTFIDQFDALTRERPYRKIPYSSDEARLILIEKIPDAQIYKMREEGVSARTKVEELYEKGDYNSRINSRLDPIIANHYFELENWDKFVNFVMNKLRINSGNFRTSKDLFYNT